MVCFLRAQDSDGDKGYLPSGSFRCEDYADHGGTYYGYGVLGVGTRCIDGVGATVSVSPWRGKIFTGYGWDLWNSTDRSMACTKSFVEMELA